MIRNLKTLITVAIIYGLLFLSGCSYLSYKTYYSDIKDYSKIKELSGLNMLDDMVLPLFPESLDNLEVKNFFCRYDQQLPLGEGFQILLTVKYSDNNLFDKELNRICALGFDSNKFFEKNNLLSYAKRMGKDESYEYTLIDESNKLINYIYLQSVPIEEIEFDHKLLPDGYNRYGKTSE